VAIHLYEELGCVAYTSQCRRKRAAGLRMYRGTDQCRNYEWIRSCRTWASRWTEINGLGLARVWEERAHRATRPYDHWREILTDKLRETR